MQDIELNPAMNDALKGLTAVKQNLSRFRTWPNYGIARQVVDQRLSDCQQHLRNLLAANNATPTELRDLIEQINTDTLPLLQQIIDYNRKMIGMEPLNPHRKLDSRSGQAHNAAISKAQEFLQQLIARTEAIISATAPKTPQPPQIEPQPTEPTSDPQTGKSTSADPVPDHQQEPTSEEPQEQPLALEDHLATPELETLMEDSFNELPLDVAEDNNSDLDDEDDDLEEACDLLTESVDHSP